MAVEKKAHASTSILPSRTDVKLIMLDEKLLAGERPALESLEGDLAGYVLQGELWFEVKGESPQVLQPGDAFYVPAGRPVRGRCNRGESVRLVTAQLKSPLPSGSGRRKPH